VDLKRKCNVKTFYFSIKTTIAIVSLLIVSWFYFSKPTFRFADIKYYECNSLIWRHFDESFSLVGGFDIYHSDYVNNYMKKYSSWNLPDQEVRKHILQGCNLARDDRRTLITIFSVLSATIFLSIPKPKASSEPKRVGSAPVGTGVAGGNTPNSAGSCNSPPPPTAASISPAKKPVMSSRIKESSMGFSVDDGVGRH